MNYQSSSSNLLYINASQKPTTGYLFGLQIPFLPDFLLDHTLLGKEPSERIVEHCRRWTQFVSGLWRSKNDVTYALRFDLNITDRSIDIYILGRLHTSANSEGQNQALILLADLHRMLEYFGFEPTLLTSQKLHFLAQAQTYSHYFEVCQEEVLTPIRKDTPINQPAGQRSNFSGNSPNNPEDKFSIPKEFTCEIEQKPYLYGIRPWWGVGGTFLIPFNAIAAQNAPVSICILLAPTQLSSAEQALIAEIAREAESIASMQTKGLNFGNPQVRPSQNKTDPQLRWESRIYAAELRRLTHPFLATIFCCSDDAAAAQQVAYAFASTLREEKSDEPPLGETEAIPPGAKVIHYANDSYLQIACQYLDFTPLISPIHSQNAPHSHLLRLRYLLDGRGAACAFRFPVSVQGGVPGIPVKQRPPDFHPGPRKETIPADAIDLGKFHVGGRAYVSKNAFTKHAFITGFTGSGKSNTSLYLLDQFYRKFQIPFLVIESAKKEYRGLRNVDIFSGKLRIYTLGNDTISPLRFNPFELISGVRVESHIANLQTCFEGALPHVGPLPSVIAESLEIVYRQQGWQLTDYGSNPGQDPRQFPTIGNFYETVEEVLKNRGYLGEVKSNLEAAIKGRIKPLLMGSKGLMFSQSLSHPSAEELFNHPVILELNDLNEQDKSLVMMFLLTLLREYRELNPSKDLIHITLVEEAHNVLANVASMGTQEGGASDVKARAVQAFCNMLAEVRAYGEGLIIADQSPEKLARDAMRNTNVQIAHQLRDAHDREAIANAMIMSEEQRDYLGKCEPGRAAVFYTGLQKATFIDVPVYKDKPTPVLIDNQWCGFDDHPQPRSSDKQVREYMSQFRSKEAVAADKSLDCSLCKGASSCQFKQQILLAAEQTKLEFQQTYKNLCTAAQNKDRDAAILQKDKLVQLAIKATGISSEQELDLAWCYWREMWSRFDEPVVQKDFRTIESIRNNLRNQAKINIV
ncbi:hypothetical protein NIES2100_77470 [Calothrix sp. NIES-2100]|uniref:ATP-binding protein n=1 Tax=Calothrix sp. NIES-2100 TaxID=1954172 RepID=UPI000B6212E4|nr:hypothetical protein NIES2100_77470 [Calothrix sp. NIES-2100]